MKILLAFLSILIIISGADKFHEIPKTLWTFWDSGFDSAKLFTRMCINNMAYYSSISGWQFKFLSNENYTQYISKESLQRLNNMYQHSQHKIGKQNWADLMRLFLIYENGGMWIDTNSFFLGNFSWIQNLEKEKWVRNRLTSQPQIITFSLDSVMGGNSTRVFDDLLGQEVILFPGVEIWSFVSKPKSKFLTDVINRLEYSLKTKRQILDEETTRENILFGREKDPYFFTSNYVFQSVLQKKQHQLQSSTSKGVSRYAVEHYQMWTIPSQDTIFGIFSIFNWFTFSIVATLFQENIQTYNERYGLPLYFIKFNGGNYPHFNNALNYQELINCMGIDARIREGSVFDEFMIQRSPNLSEIKKLHSLYEQTYMDNHECHNFDQLVSSYFTDIKINISLFIIVAIAFHICLFKIIKNRITKRQKI